MITARYIYIILHLKPAPFVYNAYVARDKSSCDTPAVDEWGGIFPQRCLKETSGTLLVSVTVFLAALLHSFCLAGNTNTALVPYRPRLNSATIMTFST